MSLEGAVSIVGSEVMPLDYGSMDSESSPSPSSSEKTVEGVREMRWWRLWGMRWLAGVEERACSAPRDHWMPIYSHYLIVGLRFPIPELLVDDTKWDRGDAEVRELASWKAKRANQNSAQCIEAAELYGPSALSEAEMDQFLNTAGGVAIPKKPRKKSRTSTKQVDEGRARKVVVLATSAETEEEALQLKRKGWEERRGGMSASWVNGLAQEFMDSMRERSLLQRQSDQLQKEKEELEKKNKELQESLDEVVPTVKQLEQERASLSTKLVFEESKRRIFESEREAQAQEIKLMNEAFVELKGNVQTLVHNGMKEHINNFISSSSFDNIVNLYRLPTAIIAFTDCRKKVKAEYSEVDITKITFGEQEEGVEEDGESMSADFRPQIKLMWERDVNERVVFPPQFDFEFVAVEEEGAEVEEDEVEGVEVDERQPVPEVEIHPVPSNDEQPPLPDEQ
ncbi:hypothetical protein SLEP1_g3708 [Rubroshorea leprosula]|uniref:Uncharacterized protein n=1 Tax=Rubroshorea leprosula TaxID=152421 RepID=A0AAV5HUG9_9ROSI|nr:hypothetical protein SLEP1_g3708 [Rubroshorea leprosula]